MSAPSTKEELVLGHYHKQVSTKLDGLDAQKPLFYGEVDAKKAQLQKPKQSEEFVSEYFRDRTEIKQRGQQLAFDHTLTEHAGPKERKAKELLEIVRANDDIAFYSQAEPLTGYRGQKHRRWAGDHFLTNWDILNETALFKVATKMPKGAHLHIHFNSTLLPHVLLDIAKYMAQIYISSDKPLNSIDNFNTCEIQFLMKSEVVVTQDREKLRKIGPKVESRSSTDTDTDIYDLFASEYIQRTDERNQRLSWMKYSNFRNQWEQHQKNKSFFPKTISRAVHAHDDQGSNVMTWKEWLISKLVFDEQEAHNSLQTAEG